MIFILPILISAYLGGLGPGLFATALVGLATVSFVTPHTGGWGFKTPLDFAQWLFLLLEGVLISVLFAELTALAPAATREALSRSHVTTERKVRVGFAIAIAFLGTIGVVSYLSVVRLNENSQLVAHSQR